MSAALTRTSYPTGGRSPSPPPPPTPPQAYPRRLRGEAFGQTGIRQYVGSFLALVCSAALAVSIAMWGRSQKTSDVIDVYHPYGRTLVSSTWSRLRIAGMSGQAEQEWTWFYSSRNFVRRGEDPWEPSVWKTLGFEMRFDTGNEPRAGDWWIRVKWSTAAAAFAVWPLVHSVRQTRHARRARALASAAVEDVRFCGRCGRTVHPGDTRCAYCGRSFVLAM
jgi:hypothetical protein